MDNGSEREMVRRMLGGDEVAFDEFFADYFPRLFRFAVLRVRDQDAAEDIVQNSLIAAVRTPGFVARRGGPLHVALHDLPARDLRVGKADVAARDRVDRG